MTFTQLTKITGYDKLFQVEGRATRREFWNWLLFVICVSLVLTLIMYGMQSVIILTDSIFLSILFPFSVFSTLLFSAYSSIALMTVTIRRLHDTNRSAWYGFYSLIPVVGGIMLFYMCFIEKGTEGENKYGAEAVYE